VALDQSALLEVLDALKTAEVDDRIRQAAQTIYQALIEAELTAVIGAAHTNGPTPAAWRSACHGWRDQCEQDQHEKNKPSGPSWRPHRTPSGWAVSNRATANG
jgi:hypothetical protein